MCAKNGRDIGPESNAPKEHNKMVQTVTSYIKQHLATSHYISLHLTTSSGSHVTQMFTRKSRQSNASLIVKPSMEKPSRKSKKVNKKISVIQIILRTNYSSVIYTKRWKVEEGVS